MMVAVKSFEEEDTAPQWPLVEPKIGAKIICVETLNGSRYEVTADPGACLVRKLGPESAHRIKAYWKQCEDAVFGERLVIVWGEREKLLPEVVKIVRERESNGVPYEIVLRTTVTSKITKLWAENYTPEEGN